MRKTLAIAFLVWALGSQAQDTNDNFGIQIGTTFNASPGSDESNSSTGLGLFVESNYTLKQKLRFGLRIEPTALVWGVGVLPSGCGGECKEGSNYLIGNYLKADYLFGNATKNRMYAGINVFMLTHQRHVITSRVDDWEDTRRRMTSLGAGGRVGVLLGRFDLSASYNLVGKDFQNYFGFNLGYTVWRK